MYGLYGLLRDALDGLWPDAFLTAQAHLTIPNGKVRGVRLAFEDRISAHQYERDQIYIDRATRNMDELVRQNRTYAEQLRTAESATLFDLPVHLVAFLRDHDNLYRAAIRSKLATNSVVASSQIEVLTQVTRRLQNIRIAYYVNMIEMTRSPAERLRLMHDPLFVGEFKECTQLLQDEVKNQLTHFEALIPRPSRDVELENIGPDHNVNDHGHDIPTPPPTALDDRDPSQRCCICLSSYTPTHPAFSISKCHHTVGKLCLDKWLNSTSRNANLCPHCRTPLCERRARRPVGVTTATQAEARGISIRLGRAVIMMGDIEKMQDELFGPNAASEWRKKAMDELNYRLFEGDIGFLLEFAGPGVGRLGIRRVRWH